MQEETDEMVRWLDDNKLVVASEKTKLMILGRGEQRVKGKWDDIKIVVGGKDIKQTRSETLLGFRISQDLKWRDHITGGENDRGLIKELRMRLNMLRKLKGKASRKLGTTMLPM